MKLLLIFLGMAPLAVVALSANTPTEVSEMSESAASEPREILAVGRIEGATPEIEIRPRVSGRVVKVLVRPGEFVESGQVLLDLDDRQDRHAVTIAAAQLEGAEAQLQRLHDGVRGERQAELAALCRAKEAELDAARARLGRIRELGRAGAVSAESVDDPEARVVVLSAEAQAARARLELSQAAPRPEEIVIAEARIRAARAGLEVARLQLRRTRLVAPREGQVLDVEAVPGELTGPNAEQPAVVLADTSGSQVRAFLEEQDAVRVAIGTEARIVADGLAGGEFRGRVTRLRPRMEPKRFSSDDPAERFDIDTREIWIGFETPEAPLVGLRVRVILDPSRGVAAASESSGLASLGSNRWSVPGSHAGRP